MAAAPHEIPESTGKRFARLNSLGIRVPEQLLLHLPKAYLDLTDVRDKIEQTFESNEVMTYRVAVASKPTFESRNKQTPRIGFYVTDGEKRVKVTIFGSVFEWKSLTVGQAIFIRAKVGIYDEELQLQQPELIHSDQAGRIIPVYRGKKGVVASETMAEYIQQALTDHIDGTAEYIRRSFDGFEDEYLFKQAGITTHKNLKDLLQKIHSPSCQSDADTATLAARRLAAYEVVKEGRKKKYKKPEPGSAILIPKDAWRKYASCIPFQPTGDQIKAIEEILQDLSSPYAMSRLLNGDVGTGKSYVIGVTAVTAREFGAKVAIMTPNLLLVEQLHDEFTTWWPKLPFVKAQGASKTLPLIDDPIVIGTTALLSRLSRQKWQPNYLVVDEQERFSIKQREQLVDMHTNMLESTATCIPRTAAMITHGGMDISILRQSPVKKNIHTRIVTRDERQRLLDHVKKVVETGYQVAIIYPRVSGGQVDERKSAVQAYDIWNKHFPGKVVCLHGKMSGEEKTSVIRLMESGEAQVLVTTSVIERGLTIEKLKAGIVVNPENYGVSQLHQLRGRLVRRGGVGYFFLYLQDKVEQEAIERLQLLVDYTEGHVLSEMDMEKRGFGDLAEDSEDQHGISRSGIFNGIKMRPSDIQHALKSSTH